MKYNIAIVGATGAVGRKMLSTVLERKLPYNSITLLASRHSKGKIISHQEHEFYVDSLEGFDFQNTDLAFFSAGSTISAKYAIMAENKGCFVIDNTSCFRMEKDISLIVPEINSEALKNSKRKIFSNPNCSTIQMLVALKPIHELSKISEIVVSTYQSVSGAGQKAINELEEQTFNLLNNKPIKTQYIPKQIGFNVVPQIDAFTEERFTKEEMKMVNETRKILDNNIKVNATCVRVGTFIGHAEAVYLRLEREVTIKEIENKLNIAEGVKYSKEDYHTPITSAGKPWVYVSRLRKDLFDKNAFNLWVVSDNLLKGAALNSVQIAESLIAQKII